MVEHIIELINYQLVLGDLSDDQLDEALEHIATHATWLQVVLEQDGRDEVAEHVVEAVTVTP